MNTEQPAPAVKPDGAIDIQATPPAPVAPNRDSQVGPPITRDKAAIVATETGLQLKSFDDMWRFSRAVIASGLAPYGLDTPEKVLICLQYGLEIGLPPMSALQNIMVVNKRPAIFGDAVPGLAIASGQVQELKDEMIGSQGSDDWGYRVTVRRAGRAEPLIRTFTVADAKRAGLWGKKGRNGEDTPWITYPQRMLLMRARTYALRDMFPDRLKGLRTVEEARDHPEQEKNVTRSLDELEKKEAA